MEQCIVGIDWAQDHHQVEVQTADGTVVSNEAHGTSPRELRQLRDELLEQIDKPEELKVGIEDPTRGVVRVFLEAGMEVWVLPPRKLDATRPAYSEAEAKDDELDAHIICEELRVHDNLFYQLVPRKPVIATLSRYYRALQREKAAGTQAANRLRDLLRDYFPQFLELDWSVTDRVMLDLLEVVPTPSAVGDVTVDEIEQVLGRCRKHSAREVLEVLQTDGLPMPERVVEASAKLAEREADKLRSALKTEAAWEEKLIELLEEISARQKSGELPSAGSSSEASSSPSDKGTNEASQQAVSDIEIAMSTDGLGVRTVAGLFAEGFEALTRLDREQLRRESIAPVTKQTGRQSSSGNGPSPPVQQRRARNQHLTDTMHQIGDSLQRQNGHYRAKYVSMRDKKNHTHGRSCRQLTDQYLRVLFAMLRDRTLYDSDLHGATRR